MTQERKIQTINLTGSNHTLSFIDNNETGALTLCVTPIDGVDGDAVHLVFNRATSARSMMEMLAVVVRHTLCQGGDMNNLPEPLQYDSMLRTMATGLLDETFRFAPPELEVVDHQYAVSVAEAAAVRDVTKYNEVVLEPRAEAATSADVDTIMNDMAFISRAGSVLVAYLERTAFELTVVCSKHITEMRALLQGMEPSQDEQKGD